MLWRKLELIFLCCALVRISAAQGERVAPNVIVIVADDVGLSDVSFATRKGIIPTPNIAKLCNDGLVLDNFYAQSTCTPSRAALMTGKYAANTGLTFAMLPGAVAGLPDDLQTLPQLLREHAGYEAHMVGKWHLGHAQWKQTPVGKGFQTHVGSLLWSMEYNTKQIWSEPWNPVLVDWIRAHENGTYSHFLETRHTTKALTEEAIDVLRRHAGQFGKKKPLFLYLAYTAAHAPLVPAPEDQGPCTHIPHLWRRQFCGLMVGLDRGIGQVIASAKEHLGEDTVIVFSSDNGAAPWFGGMGEPLRGGKTTPFEQGVRVPACVADLSSSKQFFGQHNGELYKGLMHIADIFPTIAAAAGVSEDVVTKLDLDGFDMGPSFRNPETVPSPRQSVLLEMYYGSLGEFMFADEDTVAFRKGKYKLIESTRLRETLWWFEPTTDKLNNSDTTWATQIGEAVIRAMDAIFGEGPADTFRDLLVHVGIHRWYDNSQVDKVLLFDLEKDPEERENLAASLPHVVEDLRIEVNEIKRKRPKQQKFWMTIDREQDMHSTLEKGSCPSNLVPEHLCVFAHPWLSDDVDLDAIPLVDGTDAGPFLKAIALHIAPSLLAGVLGCLILRKIRK